MEISQFVKNAYHHISLIFWSKESIIFPVLMFCLW